MRSRFAVMIAALVVVGHAVADQPISLDQLGPSLSQLGQGWTSNSVVVMVGKHNNIAFRRANYLIDVEGVSAPLEKLKQLAEALDSNLVNGVQTGHVGAGTNTLGLGVPLDKKAQTDEAIRQFQEALRLKPGDAAGHTDPVPLLGQRTHTGPLTAAEAEALAIELANEKAKALYNCQPFRKGTPAELVRGHWVWHDLRGYRVFDVEATVKFAADGTNPEVDVMLLDSRPGFPLLRR
jgi:hypothetical protein